MSAVTERDRAQATTLYRDQIGYLLDVHDGEEVIETLAAALAQARADGAAAQREIDARVNAAYAAGLAAAPTFEFYERRLNDRNVEIARLRAVLHNARHVMSLYQPADEEMEQYQAACAEVDAALAATAPTASAPVGSEGWAEDDEDNAEEVMPNAARSDGSEAHVVTGAAHPSNAEDLALIEEFQRERTAAISEMFDGRDALGIYPTTRFFERLDRCVERLLIEKGARL